MIPALSNVLITPASPINASTFPSDDDDDDIIFLGGPEEQKNAEPIFVRIDANDDVNDDDVVWIDSSKEQKNDKSQLQKDEMVKESQGSSSASSTLSALIGRPRGRPRKEKIPENKVPKKRGRPKKQLEPVNMEALDLILAQPTYGGRPVRKRAWQDLSSIDMFSSSDEEVKRPKASTGRISTPRNVAKNDGKNLQSGGRAKKEMETSLGALTPTTSSRNTPPRFENDVSISSSSPWLVVDVPEIGTEEEEQPLSPNLNQEPLRTPVKPRERVYEDLTLPEYDWRLPREDLYEDKDVPLPLNLRDFQHTPRVLPKFKAKTENSYFLKLDAYEEQKEKEKRIEQRRRQAKKIQSHGRLRNSQQQQLQDFPDPLFLSPLEDREVLLRAEMESLIGRFGGLCDEARELIPDLSKGLSGAEGGR
ncbi:unnamed protein product, partial [Mesorhabditis belari]|uniref:Uncharacterized protein n=1 Tax=Mesorhabditis belari TaxID=2138241 RepID=A0AAF3F5I6_9BILA